MPVEIQAEENELNALEIRDHLNNEITSRVDSAGTFITRVNTAPNDNDLEIGECAMWYDIGDDAVKFRARKASGTWLTGEVKLG